MPASERSDFELWRHEDGRIKSYPAEGASRLVVRAASIRQAYWAAANLQAFDEDRQCGPVAQYQPAATPRRRQDRSVEERQSDDECVLYATLNVLQGRPQGPVTLRAIREWCETWQRPLDDLAVTAALRRLELFGFIQREPGRGKASVVRIVHQELQQLAGMRESRTAMLRARNAIQ